MEDMPEAQNQENQGLEPEDRPQPDRVRYDNVWLGLGGGLIFLVFFSVLSLLFIELLAWWLAAGALVFFGSLFMGFRQFPRLALGLILSLGVYVILVVGGCILLIANLDFH
ncbi:hypothetical protein [Acanthopleuribacter pedis]|uniref:Uncharacterized protein n=1 Tax=Acanthopleuribacter pedis TaxID=442870 RepID=A0A8J7QCM8_9BACT|nr:hypothetical protein [Acanthopleuribacter pedis]MBO1321319.1 hypothetical protein [Acanthopleuribacter pedis]